MDRRAFAKGAAAIASVSVLPPSAAKAMRAGDTIETQMDALVSEFIASAKAIDPDVKGIWVARTVEKEQRVFCLTFDREKPLIERPNRKT